MGNREEIIGVRVTESEKKKFEKHAEENNEFDSVSRMMRVLATREVATGGEQEVSIDQRDIVEAVDVAVAPLTEKVEELESHLLAIDTYVSDDDEIDKLAGDIYDGLPVASGPDDLPSFFNIEHVDSQSDFERARTRSTPEAWAEYFDVSLPEARRALSRMTEQFPDVESCEVKMGGRYPIEETHSSAEVRITNYRYYREEDS